MKLGACLHCMRSAKSCIVALFNAVGALMKLYEYRVVPAPLRTQRVKGKKTTQDRFAHLLTEVINAEAEDGWEYVRAESLPCEERKGLTKREISTQTMLIFRRMPAEAEREARMAAEPDPLPVAPAGSALPPMEGRAPSLGPARDNDESGYAAE